MVSSFEKMKHIFNLRSIFFLSTWSKAGIKDAMKRKHIFTLGLLLFLVGCQTPNVLSDMRFQTNPAPPYLIASWHKITAPGETLKIYIEGDGHAFDASGNPTDNPTPQSTFLREIAANDPAPNVVYLARPCQYVQAGQCTQKDWTTGRFSKEVVNSTYQVVKSLKKKAKAPDVILIGYSGGAQLAGLVAVKNPSDIKGIITIAGVLDHAAWTSYHKDKPLTDSDNLLAYRSVFKMIPQHHFAGGKDNVVPPKLIEDFVQDPERVTVVPKATHNSGYKAACQEIYKTR